ncbi:hypothetical protein FJY90_01700 [Candidatus Gottesmanbacteria bacterium]|nr:hypothetical protein [Candidatus Gottesmanbacteria bacterium]
MSFIQPAFAQGAEILDFPVDEVGITAYIKIEKAIDLKTIEFIFETVLVKASNYLIGSIKLKDMPPGTFPCVYVHQNGWIVAYYPLEIPTAMIIYWTEYSGSPTIRTTLQEAIEKICSTLNIPPGRPIYYHFGYPEAKKLLLVLKKPQSSFFYTIPTNTNILECSFANDGLYVTVDEEREPNSYVCRDNYGVFPKKYLLPGRHTVELSYGKFTAKGFVLVFLYS